MAEYDRSHRRTSILCINCNICMNTLRRYQVLALDPRVAGFLCSWVCPRVVLQEDVVCEACGDLEMFAVNENLQQDVSGNTDHQAGSSHQGHTNVCLLCGLSTLRRWSDKILRSNPSQLQQSMIAIIESRVAPREISQHDVVCHTCWLRIQREARRMSTVDATRSQLSTSPPQEEPQVLEELQVSQSEQATHSIDEVTLPDYRRAANTNHHCIFLNCESTALHSISDKLRAIILSDYKYHCLRKPVFLGMKKYYVYILIENNIPGSTVVEYCCSCLVGRRTVGCSLHTNRSVVSRWARHQEHISAPAGFLDEIIIRDEE